MEEVGKAVAQQVSQGNATLYEIIFAIFLVGVLMLIYVQFRKRLQNGGDNQDVKKLRCEFNEFRLNHIKELSEIKSDIKIIKHKLDK